MRILEQLKVEMISTLFFLMDEIQYLLGTSQTGIQVLERLRRRKRMNELITGLNGVKCSCAGYYHAAYLCSIASFHCVMMSSFMRIIIILSFIEKCNGSPADTALIW